MPADGSSKSTQDLEKQIAKLQDDVADLTKALGAVGKEKLASVRDRGEDVLDEAGFQLHEVEAQAANYVRSHPIQALALAAGLGLLVGVLTRKR